jgi:hypothetical protein
MNAEDKVWLLNACLELNSAILAPKFVLDKDNINRLIELQRKVGREELNKEIDNIKEWLKDGNALQG